MERRLAALCMLVNCLKFGIVNLFLIEINDILNRTKIQHDMQFYVNNHIYRRIVQNLNIEFNIISFRANDNIFNYKTNKRIAFYVLID